MTNITPSEIKLLYMEVIIVAIAGVFLLLFNASPINQSATVNGTIINQTTVETSSSNAPWSTKLVDQTLGLPVGFSAIIIVSSIFLIPMTIMNALTIARLIKDFATQWV